MVTDNVPPPIMQQRPSNLLHGSYFEVNPNGSDTATGERAPHESGYSTAPSSPMPPDGQQAPLFCAPPRNPPVATVPPGVQSEGARPKRPTRPAPPPPATYSDMAAIGAASTAMGGPAPNPADESEADFLSQFERDITMDQSPTPPKGSAV